MQEYNFQTTKTARYYLSSYNNLIFNLLTVCLHGYGQLAKYFHLKFKPIESSTAVLTPEALNRYYLSGYNSRVGASWMTKEDRLAEIEDYIHYLNNLTTHVLTNKKANPKKLNAIGFSQGASTLLRWVNSNKIKFNTIILCSGAIPEELFFKSNINAFKRVRFFILYDQSDSLLTKTRLQQTLNLFNKHQLNKDIILHKFGHHPPLINNPKYNIIIIVPRGTHK